MYFILLHDVRCLNFSSLIGIFSGEGSGTDDPENQAENSDTDNEEQQASDIIKQVLVSVTSSNRYLYQ